MIGPNRNTLYPIKDYDKLVFLKNSLKAANIIVGDYTNFDNPRYGADKLKEYNVLYNYNFSKVKLINEKFYTIAAVLSKRELKLWRLFLTGSPST